jgi:hypothetical protein
VTSNRFTTFDAVNLILGAEFFALAALSVVATFAKEWWLTGDQIERFRRRRD